jgi:hypothetical protein
VGKSTILPYLRHKSSKIVNPHGFGNILLSVDNENLLTIILNDEVVDTSIDDGVYFSSGNMNRNHFNVVRDVTHFGLGVVAVVKQWLFLPECLPCRIAVALKRLVETMETTRRRQKYGCRWWNRLQDSVTEITQMNILIPTHPFMPKL